MDSSSQSTASSSQMILQTTDSLDSVCLEAFYEQLRKARRDLSQIEADALSGMTIATPPSYAPLVDYQYGHRSVRGSFWQHLKVR